MSLRSVGWWLTHFSTFLNAGRMWIEVEKNNFLIFLSTSFSLLSSFLFKRLILIIFQGFFCIWVRMKFEMLSHQEQSNSVKLLWLYFILVHFIWRRKYCSGFFICHKVKSWIIPLMIIIWTNIQLTQCMIRSPTLPYYMRSSYILNYDMSVICPPSNPL